MQQVKVGGTTYSIIRGKTKIGGTGYTIFGGKTKVGGTAYAIELGAVPVEYRRVKWIASTARKAYINTPINTQPGLKMQFEVGRPAGVADEYRKDFYFSSLGFVRSGGGSGQVFYLYNRSTTDQEASMRGGSNATREANYDYGGMFPEDTLFEVYVDFGITATGTGSLTFNGQSVTSTSGPGFADERQIRIFSTTYFWSSGHTITKGMFGRISAYDINDALIMDLWPCYRRSDGEPGFWDSVSKTFLSNSGTGSLIAGPTVIS